MNPKTLTCQLDLGSRSPLDLVRPLEGALSLRPGELRLELFHGKACPHPDLILLLHDILLARPDHTILHADARTRLFEGEVLLWLAGDIRSVRENCCMRISSMRFLFGKEHDVPGKQTHASSSHRAVLKRISPYLPVEVLDTYLWQADLSGWGLLPDPAMDQLLAETAPATSPTGQTAEDSTAYPRRCPTPSDTLPS